MRGSSSMVGLLKVEGGDAVVALRRAVPGTLPALGLEVGGGLMGIVPLP